METISLYVNYSAVETTSTFHNSPRFGHSSDFADLFSTNEDARSDYVRGVIFAGVLIFSFFFSWLVLLLVFKCKGAKIGFLSGAPMVNTEGQRVGCIRPKTVRALFCLSTLMVIVFTIVLVNKGLKGIKNTTNSLDQSNMQVADILEQFQGIATDLRAVGANAEQTRSQIVQQLDNFCPEGGAVAQEAGANLKTAGKEAAALLGQLGDFIGGDVANAQESLTNAQSSSDALHRELNKFDFHKLAVSFIIIYIVLPTCILLGVLIAWCGRSNPCIQCVLSWLILPMWLVMVMVAVLCTGLSSWMVIANADFCSGGQDATPDATVHQILDNRNVNQNSFIGQVAYFYVSQCANDDPWEFIRGYEANLTSANQTISNLVTELNQVGLSNLEAVCQQDYAPFVSLLVEMEVTLGTLVKNAQVGLNLLSCETIVPIYTNTVYDTSCHYSISALSWSFASFLVISFFGMMMITLRSAWQPEAAYDDSNKGNMDNDTYMESAAPDDEDQPLHWNTFGDQTSEPDYNDGSYQDFFSRKKEEDDDDQVIFHDETSEDSDDRLKSKYRYRSRVS